MGTINYGTSDYITMGIRPYDYDDFINDSDFVECYNEDVSGVSLETYIYETIADYYDCDRMNFDSIREKYDFYYYHVVLKPGYYEGYYIDIENNYGVCYDSWEDRRDANKEITQIKKFLVELAGCGFVSVYPGWCMGYANYNQTLIDINQAVKEMRNEVRTIPTYRQIELAGEV